MKYHVEFDVDLRRNPFKGLYIVLEGIDGAGKTTQAVSLKEYFERQGREVVLTKEPTREGLIGELINRILQNEAKIPRVALQYLFAADRQVHLKEVVIPALKKGKVVISDRCFWSSIAYGLADIEDYNQKDLKLAALSILSMYHQFIVPDFTFYLNISVEEALKRLSNKKGKEIYEEKDQLKKISEGYKLLFGEFPKEIAVLDGEKSLSEVTKEILQKIQNS